MASQAPEWYVTQYEKRAMHIYQNQGNMLRPMVTQATRVDAEKAVFWLAGKGKAVKRKRGDRNVPMNSARKKFEVALEEWTANDTVEDFDADRMNVDELEITYQTGGMALGRATDAEIYEVMGNAKTTVPSSLDFSSGAFSAAHAIELVTQLQEQKVPWNGQVWCGLPPRQFNQLIANKQVNNADTIGTDLPFVKATTTRDWYGVNWFMIQEEDAQDLFPVEASDTQDCFIWHSSGIAWANHTDLIVKTEYQVEWNREFINMRAKGCCTPLQEGNGILRFRTSSNSSIVLT